MGIEIDFVEIFLHLVLVFPQNKLNLFLFSYGFIFIVVTKIAQLEIVTQLIAGINSVGFMQSHQKMLILINVENRSQNVDGTGVRANTIWAYISSLRRQQWFGEVQ